MIRRYAETKTVRPPGVPGAVAADREGALARGSGPEVRPSAADGAPETQVKSPGTAAVDRPVVLVDQQVLRTIDDMSIAHRSLKLIYGESCRSHPIPNWRLLLSVTVPSVYRSVD